VIGGVLHRPAIRVKNVDNMHGAGVMLSILGSVKVHVGKDDKKKHRGARVMRTTMTVIKIGIWSVTTHRSKVFFLPQVSSMRALNLNMLIPTSAQIGLNTYLALKPRTERNSGLEC
jgi:hypothetical protein